MSGVQKRAAAALENGEDAEGELDELRTIVGAVEMPHYAERVRELSDLDRLAKLPRVVHDLLPKFRKVYQATGDGLVSAEAGYSQFNALEREELVLPDSAAVAVCTKAGESLQREDVPSRAKAVGQLREHLRRARAHLEPRE